MTVHFTVPGKPMGKQRPRFNSRTRTTYTPEETLSYEEDVQWAYRMATKAKMLKGNIKAEIVAYYPIPKSTSKKQREAMIEGYILPAKKPDTDNIAKIILDSLNGIAYNDDSQVVSLSVIKRYSENPHVDVRLEEI